MFQCKRKILTICMFGIPHHWTGRGQSNKSGTTFEGLRDLYSSPHSIRLGWTERVARMGEK
jgi:hypothetical protein